MFEKVLIANRGEIAIRVMRACRELDMKSVAVYSDADKTSLYTNYADESVPLGNPSPSQSYLNIEKIINAAIETGADAIHPGYGFLAENPELGRQCEKNGIKLIGPKVEHIVKMGDKITSKQLMKDAGVPVIEGTPEGITDIEIPGMYVLDYEYHEKRNKVILKEFKKEWEDEKRREKFSKWYQQNLIYMDKNYEKQDLISEIKTERFIRIFQRILYHFPKGKINSYPGEADNLLHINIPIIKNKNDINGDILKEFYELVDRKYNENER